MRILVAMSGGVDSSVVAHLLKEQGHECIGVMMQLWTDPLAPEVRRSLPKKCCSVEHIQRARQVCESIDIPFYVMNLEQEFKEEVVDPFLDAYARGETPNPCIQCNRLIKFGALLEKANELGCEKVATGHYARVIEEVSSFDSAQDDKKEGCHGERSRTMAPKYHLYEATDKQKDQSYYLYTLSQTKLSKVLFPLGEMQKQDVYVLAQKYGVWIPQSYHESQDLCFYPEKDPKAFLERYISDAINPGEIRNQDDEVVGEHKGLPLYTIGQRRGLNIGGLKIPLHVTRKDVQTNTLYVSPSGDDLESSLSASSLKWMNEKPEENQDHTLEARINSLGKKYQGSFRHDGENGTYKFPEGVRGIAKGQSLVLYQDDQVIGGGIID